MAQAVTTENAGVVQRVARDASTCLDRYLAARSVQRCTRVVERERVRERSSWKELPGDMQERARTKTVLSFRPERDREKRKDLKDEGRLRLRAISAERQRHKETNTEK